MAYSVCWNNLISCRSMYEIEIYARIIRERGKKTKEKNNMSEGQCALEKIIMLIITLTGKKKRTKEKDKNLLLTKKKNYKNSDIPHCSHNCNKTNQHIVILLENLCSLKFFHV